MSRILQFPNQTRSKAMTVEPDAEVLAARLNSTPEALRKAIDLLDQMQSKIEQMHHMLPARIAPGFEDQQLEISNKIGLIRSEVASISIILKDTEGR